MRKCKNKLQSVSESKKGCHCDEMGHIQTNCTAKRRKTSLGITPSNQIAASTSQIPSERCSFCAKIHHAWNCFKRVAIDRRRSWDVWYADKPPSVTEVLITDFRLWPTQVLIYLWSQTNCLCYSRTKSFHAIFCQKNLVWYNRYNRRVLRIYQNFWYRNLQYVCFRFWPLGNNFKIGV